MLHALDRLKRVEAKFTLKQVEDPDIREVKLYALTLAIAGTDCLTSDRGRFTPGKRPGSDCTGGWMETRAGLDTCGKSRSFRDSYTRLYVHHRVKLSSQSTSTNHTIHNRLFEFI
jgi:hypothetical protein